MIIFKDRYNVCDNKYLQTQDEVGKNQRLLQHRACLSCVFHGFYFLVLKEDEKIQGNAKENHVFIFCTSKFSNCISGFLVEKV